jgi:hypothetical protein
MPNLDGIPELTYRPNDPYHWHFDNLPLKNIFRRQALINMALDNVIALNRDAIGTQGTVANRLNQSIDADGNLKTAAIDEAEHSIEAHTDTETYVRMLRAESDKLDNIADEANSFSVAIQEDEEGEDVTTFDDGVLQFIPSPSVYFEITAPNKVQAHMTFPVAAAHSHYYDQTPIHVNSMSPDYTNYKVNSSATPYITGSLRVYINGVRLTSSESIYVPGNLVNDAWTLLSFTPDEESGTFELSAAISSEDIIRIDYDISFI